MQLIPHPFKVLDSLFRRIRFLFLAKIIDGLALDQEIDGLECFIPIAIKAKVLSIALECALEFQGMEDGKDAARRGRFPDFLPMLDDPRQTFQIAMTRFGVLLPCIQ